MNKALFSGALEAVRRPIETAHGLPNDLYLSADAFIQDRDRVMASSWPCIGFASDLPEPGHVRPLWFMGLPLLITRNQGGDIQVFHNVCSHRGMHLVAEACKVKGVIRCPYHSWTYDLDGNLKGTPHVGGFGVHEHACLDPAKHGLKPVRTARWHDLIFINLSAEAVDFATYIQPIEQRFERFVGAGGMREYVCVDTGGDIELRVNSNWKLAVDNNLESYHLPWIHPYLNKISPLDKHYHITGYEHVSGQGSRTYSLESRHDMGMPHHPAWPRDQLNNAEYPVLYPNTFLGVHVDQLFVLYLDPLAPDLTRERVKIYYVGDTSNTAAYEARRLEQQEAWREVFSEDIKAVEGMQRGRASPGYSGGVFSPVMETPTHHFHNWIADRLAG